MTRPVSHPPELPAILVEDQVRAALAEDLGRAGDVTTLATIGPDRQATAVLAAREPGVLAGLTLAQAAFRLINPQIAFDTALADGAALSKGTVIATVSGRARALLSAERVALNYLMHLSGVASLTARFAAEIAHTHARITCTRKTLPGLRGVEKYAVRLGGGSNHRFGLDDAILIKDNHIAVAGGIAPALTAARAYAGHLLRIEIEVDTLDQFREALAAGAEVVLLDNMTPEQLAEAVALNAAHHGLIAGGDYAHAIKRTVLEASGNVALSTVRAIAESGVDFISTSKITMAAPTLDIGLDIAMA